MTKEINCLPIGHIYTALIYDALELFLYLNENIAVLIRHPITPQPQFFLIYRFIDRISYEHMGWCIKINVTDSAAPILIAPHIL